MKKPLIALVVDVREWAFHNIATNIELHLRHQFDFKIFFIEDYESNIDILDDLKGYDLIHFFWRDLLHQILSYKTYREYRLFNTHEEYEKKIFTLSKTKITTSAYDHLLLSDVEIKEREFYFNDIIDEYTVSSEILNDIYNKIDIYPKPISVIEDGVNLDLFTPKTEINTSEELVVGWAGNSEWGHSIDGIDHKGFYSILKPAIDELQEEGYKIRGFFADKATNYIPRPEMNNYYNSIDIYICTSDKEGTPNPVLESMAKGIGVISTNVGIVPNVFGEKQLTFILKKRDKAELKKLILKIFTDRSILKELKIENLTQIQSWSWKEKSIKWDAFFNYVLNKDYNSKRKIFLENYITNHSLVLKKEKKSLTYLFYLVNRSIGIFFETNYIGQRLLWRYESLKKRI